MACAGPGGRWEAAPCCGMEAALATGEVVISLYRCRCRVGGRQVLLLRALLFCFLAFFNFSFFLYLTDMEELNSSFERLFYSTPKTQLTLSIY